MSAREFTSFFPFGGLGAGARGFMQAFARLAQDSARFKNLGGIDNDPAACADFKRLSGAPSLCGDVSQLTPAELLAWLTEVHGAEVANRRPDCVFTSPPCKGFSRLLGNKKALEAKYQKLNQLVYQGLFLMCETWSEPPPMIILENVPGIVSRGADLLYKAQQLLGSYRYLFNRATHDCGEIGGLAQHRKRFLLICRQPEQVPAYVYQPPKQRVKACGEVLEQLPIPGGDQGGALHKLPNLSWLNWVRLSMIPAGGDWRDLPGSSATKEGPGITKRKGRHVRQFKVSEWQKPTGTVTGDTDVQTGALNVADPRLVDAVSLKCESRPGLLGVLGWDQPAKSVTGSASVTGSNGTAAVADPRAGRMGVIGWDEPAKTVCGESYPSNGSASVADPRVPPLGIADPSRGGALGVISWDAPAPTITGKVSPGSSNTPGSVADPRVLGMPQSFGNVNRVTSWSEPVGTITAAPAPSSGAPVVADPRLPPELMTPLKPGEERRAAFPKYDVRGWTDPARTVAGSGTNGGFGVADPRVALEHSPYRGALGVTDWTEPSPTVRGKADARTSPSSVADPRIALECNPNAHRNKYAVTEWTEPSNTVTGATRPGSGGPSVADPRLGVDPAAVPLRKPCRNGSYGVMSWQDAAATVTGSACIDNGRVAVADPRKPMKGPVPIIIAADGTWHRPLTTLELAVLQGLPAVLDGEPLMLHGTRVASWRERVGNAVPVGAAKAIAETILKSLLAASLGTWFLALSGEAIWVRIDGTREDEFVETLGLGVSP